MNYDWIQWYYVVLLALGFAINWLKDGEPRENYCFKSWFLSLVICSPWVGRILGFW